MEIVRFTEQEADERLKEIATHADGEAVVRNIYSYLLQYGAVREDVYAFFVEKWELLCKTDYNFLIELLRGQAERTWFDFFTQVGQEKLSATLYKREIIDGFRKGMTLEEVKECYSNASCPYDMTRAIQGYQLMEEKEPVESAKDTEEVLRLREELQKAREELEKANAEIEMLRRMYREEEEPEQQEFEELQNEECNSEQIVMEDEWQESGDVLSEGEPMHSVMIEPKKIKKKVSLFQHIRHIKHRVMLEKMTYQRKMEELFILMKAQNYTPKMIRSIRTVIDYGITFEFLYAFVESGASEKELEALVLFKAPVRKESEEVHPLIENSMDMSEKTENLDELVLS